MNKSQRQRIIADLAKLQEPEFDSLLAEVREARGVEQAGVNCLRQLFEAKAAHSPLAAVFGSRASQAEE